MPRKKTQVAMKPSRAIKMLRRLKNVQPDELGDLGFILSSETSSLVRCHNHSFTVAMQKQMDIWYRHHVTTMRKLSHGQQSEYRNLMKVKNDKRKMYRSGVMRQRDEEEFDHRMKADRDRNAAEVKLLNLSLDDDDDEPEVEDEVDLARKEADRSGWLRIIRREHLNSSDLLPTIHDVSDDRYRDSSPTFSPPIVDEDLKDVRKGNVDSDDDERNGHSTFKSEGHRGNGINSITLDSAVNEADDDDDTGTMRRNIPTVNSRGHTPSSDVVSNQGQIVNEAQRSHQEHADHIVSSQYIHNKDRNKQNKLFNLVDNRARFTEDHDLDREPVDGDMNTLGDRLQNFEHVKSRSKDGLQRSPGFKYPLKNDYTNHDDSVVAIHPVTDLITKREPDAGSDLRETGEMFHTKDVGIIQSKRLQKLPNLDLQPIDQVIRYQRQETDGALVGTVTAVKPSVEKFPLPSKRSQYHRRKALQWHVEQAPALHTKIQQFLSECDAVPRPAPTLHTRPVFFFSRHHPVHTTSVEHASTAHGADAMTRRRNEILYDVEAMKRKESLLCGHNMAITKEMMSRKHGVATPHK